mgnify:CR=1 FL=1
MLYTTPNIVMNRVSARILYLSVISKPIITRERRPDRATRAYDKYYLLQKTVFEGIWKLKRLKLIFLAFLDIILGINSFKFDFWQI